MSTTSRYYSLKGSRIVQVPHAKGAYYCEVNLLPNSSSHHLESNGIWYIAALAVIFVAIATYGLNYSHDSIVNEIIKHDPHAAERYVNPIYTLIHVKLNNSEFKVNEHDIDALIDDLDSTVSNVQQATIEHMDAWLEREIMDFSVSQEEVINSFLDWYYGYKPVGFRIAARIMPNYEEALRNSVYEKLEGELGFETSIQQFLSELPKRYMNEMTAYSGHALEDGVASLVQSYSDRVSTLPTQSFAISTENLDLSPRTRHVTDRAITIDSLSEQFPVSLALAGTTVAASGTGIVSRNLSRSRAAALPAVPSQQLARKSAKRGVRSTRAPAPPPVMAGIAAVAVISVPGEYVYTAYQEEMNSRDAVEKDLRRILHEVLSETKDELVDWQTAFYDRHTQ